MAKLVKVKNDFETEHQFPVVGIGASAGGLEAFKTFLRALPAKSGMAFVFIQHLSPQHPSILPEILEKVSPFPVQQITDNLHLEKDHLYIIPENKVVTVVDSVLKLAPLDKKNTKSNTVDLFFSSLGVVYQSFAVGVVLSGALTDGTLGLQVIKSYGGLTFAQDEGSAAFDSMPKSAVKAGVVDFILPPEKIAEQLIAINHPFHTDYSKSEKTEALPRNDEDIFKQILTVLRVRRGVDFNYYKQSTLKRRIIRRMALNKLEKTHDYLAFLRESKTEQDALYNDMLISVTNFFRDTQSFEVICGDLFPELISQKAEDGMIRVWVAGCATGEEAYSMAMCLQEHLGDKAAAMKIQIFATDISEIAITKARIGIYQHSELQGISPSRLQQFFVKLDGNYQVTKSVRDMCVFAHHNLLKDPPFSKIDLVSCRNVLIYLEPVLQKRALTTFHYSLNEEGFLVLGKSETIGNNTDIFTAYNGTEKIYRRKGPAGRFMTVSSYNKEQSFRKIDMNVQKESAEKDVFKLADDAMLENFMPPAVLVNEKFDVVQFRGSTELWLVPPIGKPTYNVIKMAREGLAFELRNVLHLAKKTSLPARKPSVFFKLNDIQHFVNIQAVPVKDTMEPHYLVIFQSALSGNRQPVQSEINIVPDDTAQNINEMRIEQLEKELTQARADMRAITEEQETANEELQSANEELLSGSEELQSLNEELETSKEELQSTNEEIMIVNKELLDRNEQLNNARLYTEGLIGTIRDPLIILDKNLLVKRATAGFYKKFKTNERDTEGKHIYDLGDRQWDIPRLRELLEDVLPSNKQLSDFEVTHTFSKIGTRTMCFNARQFDNINGEPLILLAIEDVTDKRKVEEGLAEAERLLDESKDRLKFAIESAGMGTWDFDPETRALNYDKRSRELFGLPQSGPSDISSFLEMIDPDDRVIMRNKIIETLDKDNSNEFNIEFKTVPINGKVKWLKSKGRSYFNELGEPTRFVGTLLDFTLEKMLDEATHELLNKKDEFFSIASHELKTPITSLKMSIQIAERETSKNEDMKNANIFLKKASKQINKLVELINELLDVTKIQAGKMELNKTKFNLTELIAECSDELHNNSTKHQFVLKTEGEVEIYADRNRIEQVMVNLLSNAVKYSPEGEKVIIQVNRTDQSVNIAVTDFGIGIGKSSLPFVFDRFYRVDDAQQYTGLGLGLYISADIVRKHGGSINVESEEGKGSTFWFTIPA